MQPVLACFLVLLLSPLSVSAQKEGRVWYFGYNAGMDFTTEPPSALLNSSMRTVEGCACIADSTGQLLFYTNGVRVWNHTHSIMDNGEDLGGHISSSQAALIVPQPGHPHRYYIISSGAAEVPTPRPLLYAVVDLSKHGGKGMVVEKKQLLLWESAEKITATRHANGRDIWIVAHELNSNRFASFPVTVFGIGQPTYSEAGSSHPEQDYFSAGYMKPSHDGSQLAVAMRDSRSVELFAFDNTTGQVQGPLVTLPCPERAYGVEFSPDNSRLYISSGESPDRGHLEQYTLTSGNAAVILGSRYTLCTTQQHWFGALALAPNGRIYMAIMNSPYLAAIHSPNAAGAACDFDLQGFDLGGRFSASGLPNVHTAYSGSAAFRFVPACAGDTTTFFFSHSSFAIDSLSWNFGDPASGAANISQMSAAAHRYTTPGLYSVELNLYYQGLHTVISEEITIAVPFALDIGADTTLCAGTSLLLDAASPTLTSYRWSTGASSASIIATEPGRYIVWVSDGVCEDRDTIHVFVHTPHIEVSTRATVCPGGRIQLTASSPEHLHYQWYPQETLDNPYSSSPVASPTTTTTYTVTGISAAGCATTATVTVAVASSIHVDLGRDTTLCRGAALVLSAAIAADSYQWSTGETTAAITVTQAGLYTVTVVSGQCSGTDTIQITTIDSQLRTSHNQTLCRGEQVQLLAEGAVRYEWSPSEGLSDPFAAQPLAAPSATTRYRVIGTSAEGCADTAFVTIQVQEAPSVYTGNDTTVCSGEQVQLRAEGAVRYEWSPPEGLSDPFAAQPLAAPSATTRYRVIGTSAEGCADTAFVTIQVQEAPSVSLGNDTTVCSGEQVLLSAPAIADRYQWSTGETTASITAQSAGLYSLTAWFGTCSAYDELHISHFRPDIGLSTAAVYLCRGDSVRLSASGAEWYVWEPSTGLSSTTSATPLAYPEFTTVYTVTGRDVHGCRTTASVTLDVTPTIPVHLSLPSFAAPVGAQNHTIPLYITVPADALPLTIRSLYVEITVEASALHPVESPGFTGTISRRGPLLVIAFALSNIVVQQPRQYLAGFEALLLAGPDPTVPLRFGTVAMHGCVATTTEEGQITRTGCLPDGTAFRYFLPERLFVQPRPAVDEAVLHLHNMEYGAAQLTVYTVRGERILHQPVVIESQQHTVPLSLQSFAPGVYHLVVQTGSRAYTTSLLVAP